MHIGLQITAKQRQGRGDIGPLPTDCVRGTQQADTYVLPYSLIYFVYLVLERRIASRGAERTDRRPVLLIAWWRRRPPGTNEDGAPRAGIRVVGLLSYGCSGNATMERSGAHGDTRFLGEQGTEQGLVFVGESTT